MVKCLYQGGSHHLWWKTVLLGDGLRKERVLAVDRTSCWKIVGGTVLILWVGERGVGMEGLVLGRYEVGIDDHLSVMVFEESGQPCL